MCALLRLPIKNLLLVGGDASVLGMTVPQLLDSIMKSSKAKLFNEPVNWKLYNLLDYPTLVPDPMDLGTRHIRSSHVCFSCVVAICLSARVHGDA